MRLQDELVALHAIADASTRRYIFGQIPHLPVHFDAAELLELLDRGATDTARVVAGRALAAWDRVGPRLTLHAYGLDPGRMGLWSTLALQVAGTAPTADEGAESAPDADAQRAALAGVLAPCRDALLAAAARTGVAGELARQILGLVPIAGAEDVLADAARDPARATGALLALARRNARLAGAAVRDAGRLPGWIRATAAAAIGGKHGHALAMDLARSGDGDAAWAVAEALPDLAGEAWPEIGRALAGRGGWVPVVLADALGRLNTAATAAEAQSQIDDLLKNAKHDLVRIMAVRSLGGFPGDLATRRALKCLDRGSPMLQAAAIECLARVDYRTPELGAQLAQRAASGPLKLRGTAMLGLMVFDPKITLKYALELVNSKDAAARVEGSYVLGYLKSRGAAKLLSVLASRDPFEPAALQAEKSLAHFPEEQAAPGLIELLGHASPAVALSALRVLSHFPGESQAGVLPAIEALEKSSRPDVAPAVLRECGLLGFGVPGLTDYLARPRTDPHLRIGALEGLVRSGEIPADLARASAADPDPAISIPGSLAQLVAGDAAGATSLARWLSFDTTAVRALRAVRDLAVVAGEAGRGNRHPRLARLLARRQTSKVTSLPNASRKVVVPPPPGSGAPSSAPVPAPDLTPATRPVQPSALSQPSKALSRPASPPPSTATSAPAPSLPESATNDLRSHLAKLAPTRNPGWPKELTYLHGPATFLETYKQLAPAVLIVAAVLGWFLFETTRNALSTELTTSAKRDQLIGKVGSVVDLTGTISALIPERASIVVLKDRKQPVRVWLPGTNFNQLKVGQPVTVQGTVKDVRGDPPVVHGLSIKDG